MRKLKPLAYKSVAQEMRSDKEDGGGGTAILATAKHNRVLSNSPPKRCVIMLYLVLFNLHRIWSVKVPRCGLFHRRFPTQRWSAFGRFYGVLGSIFQAEDMQTQRGTLGAFLYHCNGKSCGTVLIATNILYLFLSDFRGEPEQRPAVLLQLKPSTTWLSRWSTSTSHVRASPQWATNERRYAMISI